MKNYYELLEINQDASPLEIQQAYKTVLSRYNPNDFSGEARAVVEKSIADAKEAYSILSDTFLRQQYDKELGINNQVNQKKQAEQEKEDYFNKQKEILKSIEELEKQNAKSNNKKKKNGMFNSMSELTKDVVSNMPEIKLKKPTKKALIAFLAAVAIVAAIGIALWCIPFTNNIIRNF